MCPLTHMASCPATLALKHVYALCVFHILNVLHKFSWHTLKNLYLQRIPFPLIDW